MKLHWSPRSPYVRKVMIVAHETGLADRLDCVRTVVAMGEPHAELMRINPQSRIPTLELDDGTVLYDSSVICEYLDGLHDGPKLFPTDFTTRMTALRRHALGHGMLDSLLPWLVERGKPEAQRSQKFTDAYRVKTRASIDALEAEVPDLAFDHPDIGHVAIANALGYVDFRFAELAWRDGHPKLTAWYESFVKRPSMQATLPQEG